MLVLLADASADMLILQRRHSQRDIPSLLYVAISVIRWRVSTARDSLDLSTIPKSIQLCAHSSPCTSADTGLCKSSLLQMTPSDMSLSKSFRVYAATDFMEPDVAEDFSLALSGSPERFTGAEFDFLPSWRNAVDSMSRQSWECSDGEDDANLFQMCALRSFLYSASWRVPSRTMSASVDLDHSMNLHLRLGSIPHTKKLLSAFLPRVHRRRNAGMLWVSHVTLLAARPPGLTDDS
mmetsp:Transcript_15482/g.43521  ORF Transcript_15482/g.43521 Transcript_15482/m.43521 type:complete len:236 (-) Transcript_15482:7-714(-)